MHSSFLLGMISTLFFFVAGCTEEPASPPNIPGNGQATVGKPSPPPPPPPPLSQTPSSNEKVEQAVQNPGNSTVTSSPTLLRTKNNPLTPSASPETVRLSAGVSLPQTGPEGILMSFSIDYEFEGTPDKTDYFWIIERSQGVSARIPVKLENQGTLVTLIQKWRPSEGPFEAHIEDKNGKHISHSVELFGQN